MPAGAQDDVSFYDHARLTSAIAVCLYRCQADQLAVNAVPAAALDRCFALLVGDLSGIQDYIFDIATIGPGGIARRLRARSFYLAALGEALGHQIARAFDIPLGNVIMASGGKFYVLVPNRADLEELVGRLRRDVDTWLRTEFNGEIAINLACLSFGGAQFQASRPGQPGFGEIIAELGRQLGREKRQRGQGVLTTPDGWDQAAFAIPRDFWGVGACASCGKFPADRVENLCAQCERDVRLGSQLTRAQYVAYYDDGSGDVPLPLGCSASVLARGTLPQAGAPYLVVKLNDPRIDELVGLPGTFRYLANHVPTDAQGAGLTFEQIVDTIVQQARGRRLLGYLKADVDVLGILFSQGLRRDGPGYDTAAHIAALSRELDLFFSGWIQHRLSCAPEPPEEGDYRDFYTIFSGGDDLFLVGPWDRAADLALDVRARLDAFTGHNPDVTLSAGILFAKERYPISRAAEDAEAVLEQSKERFWTDARGQVRTRNQLTVLGDTFPWERAPGIFAQIATLREHTQKLSSALLYDLIAYSRLYRLWKEGANVEGLRYKALFAYNIARNLRRGDPLVYRWADDLLRSLHEGGENTTMRHLGLVATYLLFARRSG